MFEWVVRSGVPLIVLFGALLLLRHWWLLTQQHQRDADELDRRVRARQAKHARLIQLAAQLHGLPIGAPIEVLQWNRNYTVVGLYMGVQQKGYPMHMIRVQLADDRVLAMTPQWWRRASVLELIARAASGRHKIP